MKRELERFYKKNYRSCVYKISNALYGDFSTAEDIVQEAFVKAIQNLDTYDKDKGKFSSWFHRIMFRTLYNFKRDQKKRQAQDIDKMFWLEDDTNYEVLTMNKVELEKVLGVADCYLLDSLIRMRIWGYTTDEISLLLEISPTNVRKISSRFKGKI